ncbi:phosphomethylpyrimidine kinase [Verruconis gallopava]|uniref:Phosphomethylpyrimidine kinase n=1 Tax=Verruconis gallopava TaxID=253628 RepID=A0A0D1ZZ95_9PEZI|nr:phosphomethylpyrimidine kinase [Verruconis gallopava]KIV99757.1 phosphomethylpyrimidine kinase [Verruconis gallopava]
MSVRRILVIAGSDSSGGAGLEADQKVIAAHGGYAMTATTALTAQNTKGVVDIHHVPPEFLKKQIDACLEDIGVDVVKTGMLASTETIKVVADALKRHKVCRTVVDPVMVSTSGAQLLPKDSVKPLLSDVLPLTTVLTPNIPEAQLLLEEAGFPFRKPERKDDLVAIAKGLQKLGPKYVLLKGGHLPLTKDGDVSAAAADHHTVFNVLVSSDQEYIIENNYQRSKNTHGTGCSLASAIAANLANGLDVPAAVQAASRYVEAGIKYSQSIGHGSGPINHFHSTYSLPFSADHFVDYILERSDVRIPWSDYTEHEFVRQMAEGTLPVERFKYYLIQDYLFLIQFSRANALAAYKANNMRDINRSAEIVRHIQAETSLHISYCEQEFGISKEQIISTEEDQACTAYTRFVLDIGHQQDFFALQIALLPCLLGYGVIARRLYDDPKTKKEGNLYWKWIKNYVADDYVEAVQLGRKLVEKEARKISLHRLEELVDIFIKGTKLEKGFWDMGMQHETALR